MVPPLPVTDAVLGRATPENLFIKFFEWISEKYITCRIQNNGRSEKGFHFDSTFLTNGHQGAYDKVGK